MRAWDVDGFVGWDEGVAAPAVREEDDGGAVALVAEDGDVGFLGAADAEGDVFAAGVGALAVDGEDFYRKILGHAGEAVFGDLLHGGVALLGILGLDEAFGGLAGGFSGIGPNFCTDLGGGDGKAGFFDFSAFEPG